MDSPDKGNEDGDQGDDEDEGDDGYGAHEDEQLSDLVVGDDLLLLLGHLLPPGQQGAAQRSRLHGSRKTLAVQWF